AGQLIDLEQKYHLAAGRIPGGAAVAHGDVAAVGVDFDARHWTAVRQLFNEITQCAPHATAGDLLLHQAARGAEHDEILEGELVEATLPCRFAQAGVHQVAD